MPKFTSEGNKKTFPATLAKSSHPNPRLPRRLLLLQLKPSALNTVPRELLLSNQLCEMRVEST